MCKKFARFYQFLYIYYNKRIRYSSTSLKWFSFNVCNKKSRCLSRLTFVFLKIYCMQADCPFLNLPETGKWMLETRGNSFSFCKVSLVWCFTSSCDKHILNRWKTNSYRKPVVPNILCFQNVYCTCIACLPEVFDLINVQQHLS